MLAVHFRHTGLGVYRLLVQYSIFFYLLFPCFDFTCNFRELIGNSRYPFGKDSFNIVYNSRLGFRGIPKDSI